ncbi:MAG: hypothetical protein IKE01_04070 [Clostridia bacterium]|nr:hypothetical protein [Clostridia bacterium]
MKKLKCTNVLKRIIISILCVITIALSMPAKVKAGVLQDFVELFMNIPDALMVLENDFIAQRNGQTYKNVNLKGIAIGGSDEGKIFNFMVTPYEIIANGKVETYRDIDGNNKKVINIPSLNANFFSSTDEENEKIPGEWELGSDNQTKSNDILRKPIGRVYKTLRNFCMILMMLVLLYIGIKIMISSSAEQQSKYKKNLVDWLVGFCLLFVMHYFMVFIATVNDLIVDMLADGDSQEFYISLPEIEGDIGANAVENMKAWAKEKFNGEVNISDVTDLIALLGTGNPLVVVENEMIGSTASGTVESFFTSWDNYIAEDKATGNVFSDTHLALPEGGGHFDTSSTRVVVPNRDWGDNGNVQLNAEIFKDFNTRRACIYKANIVEYVRTISSIGPQNTFVFTKDDKVTALNGRMLDDDLTKIEYGIFYIALVVQTLMFLAIYIKRLIQLAFLTMIAPFVAMMYPVDKIGDGQAQSFNAWLKDYFFGVLLQPIHLLLYAIFITAASELFSGNNIIYAIAVYAYMIPAEKYIKKIFGFEKAGGGPAGGGLAGALGHGAAMDLLNKGAGIGPGSWGGSKGGKGGSGESAEKGIRKNKNIPNGLQAVGGAAPANDGLGGAPAASGINPKKGNNKSASKNGNASGQKNRAGDKPGASGNGGKPKAGGLFGAISNTLGRRTIRGATGGQYSDLSAGAGAIGIAAGKRVLRGGARVGGMLVGGGVGLMLGTANALANGNFDPSQIAAATYTGLKAGDKWTNAGADFIDDFAEEVDTERAKVDENYRDQKRRESTQRKFSEEISEIQDEEVRERYKKLIDTYSPYIDLGDIHDIEALDEANSIAVDIGGDASEAIDLYKTAKKWKNVDFSTGGTAEQKEEFMRQMRAEVMKKNPQNYQDADGNLIEYDQLDDSKKTDCDDYARARFEAIRKIHGKW